MVDNLKARQIAHFIVRKLYNSNKFARYDTRANLDNELYSLRGASSAPRRWAEEIISPRKNSIWKTAISIVAALPGLRIITGLS